MCVLSRFSHIQLFATLWTVVHQTSLSMGFSRQEYWSGFPCPPLGYLPDPGVERTSLQFSSVAQPCPILCDPMDCSTPGFPVHHQLQSLLKLMSIESVMPSNHLILCLPLLLLPSIFSSIRVFSSESALHIRWPKYWSFSFRSISLSNEYSRLISLRMDWLDLLAVQGTLKSLLQHHSSKASILHSPLSSTPWQPEVCSLCLGLGFSL